MEWVVFDVMMWAWEQGQEEGGCGGIEDETVMKTLSQKVWDLLQSSFEQQLPTTIVEGCIFCTGIVFICEAK